MVAGRKNRGSATTASHRTITTTVPCTDSQLTFCPLSVLGPCVPVFQYWVQLGTLLYGETTLNPLESHQTFVTHFAQTSPRNASKCEEIPQHSSPLALAFAFFPSLPSPLRHSLLYSPLFGRAVFQYLTFYPPLSPPPPFDTNPSHPLPLPLPPYHLDLFSSSPSHHHHLYSRRLIYSIRLIIIFSTNLPILPLVTIEQQSRVPFLSRAALGPVREILTRHSRLPRTTRLDSNYLRSSPSRC